MFAALVLLYYTINAIQEYFYAASTNLLTHAEPPLSLILLISGAGSLRVMVGLLPNPDMLLRPCPLSLCGRGAGGGAGVFGMSLL